MLLTKLSTIWAVMRAREYLLISDIKIVGEYRKEHPHQDIKKLAEIYKAKVEAHKEGRE
jgi:hypothetical protein